MAICTRLPLVVAILGLGTTLIPDCCEALKLPRIDTGGKYALRTSNCYKLLGRFSFLQGSDTYDNLKYEFNYQNQSNENLWLAVYSDKSTNTLSEANFHPPEASCWDKLNQARDSALKVFNLFERSNRTARSCSDGTSKLTGSVRISYTGFSYLALIHVNPARCNKTKGIDCQGPLMNLDYKIHLTNSAENADVFHREISADEMPFAYFSMALVGLSFMAFFFAIVDLVKLRRMHRWHYIPQGLFFSSFCLLLSSCFWVVHYLFYSIYGRPITVELEEGGHSVSPLRITAQFFWLLSDESLVVCILCLAKGWTLVRHKLSPRSRSMYGIVSTVYVFYGWVALIWAASTSDFSNSVSMWDTVPGIILMVARIWVYCVFLWALKTTVTQYQQKKKFFCKVGVFFSMWFLVTPLIGLSALSGIFAPHVRFAMYQCVNMTCLSFALIFLNIMYWPGPKFTKGFPFHSFQIHSARKLAKLRQKEKESKKKKNEFMTERERTEMKKQEEQDRLLKMDPLTRFGELMRKYEKHVQACIDFTAELRVGLREIDDINAQADQLEADYHSRRRSGRRRNDNDKLDDDSSQAKGSQEGRRRERGRRDREDADADGGTEKDGGGGEGSGRKRRPRRARTRDRDDVPQ